MKRILMLGSVLTLLCNAYSQNSRTTFGIKAGVTLQNLNGRDVDDEKLNNKLKPGLALGVNAQIPIATDFYLQPGVEFNQKGAKNSDGDKLNLSYIDIPLSLVYKPMVGNGHVIFGFGPYVGFGVGGGVKSDQGDAEVIFKNEITFGEALSDDAYIRRMDAGANIFAGYEFNNKVSFQVNTQLGFIKVNPKIQGVSSDPSSVKNTGFGVSLGYRL